MSAILRFYEIDLRNVDEKAEILYFHPGLNEHGRPVVAEILYFHPGLNEHGRPVVWTRLETRADGTKYPKTQEYQPFPIEIDGLEIDGQGRLPRPTLTVSNIEGQLGRLVRQLKDLNGCIMTMRSTLSDYIDGSNFINPSGLADPSLEFPKEIFIFERKAEETPEYIKFELSSALDLEGQLLPKRAYNANYCSHEFGGPLCGATDPGPCARNIRACEARFGAGNPLPFGGFPGVGLVSR